MSMKIGDFVTGYGAGYWQVYDIKPKIATEDYKGNGLAWKKGKVIGQWFILKKAFTPKMKPKIDWSCEDSSWVEAVPQEIDLEIKKYFAEHPDYKEKFDNAPMKIPYMITNVWVDISEEQESEFRKALAKLPNEFTLDDFLKITKKYKKLYLKPPTKYILNLLSYPWCVDKKGNQIYFEYELVKN